MSRDGDFTAYVEARWSRLMRSAILLGCSVPEAEDIVQTALERCLIHWRKVERANDRDAYVYRVLFNTFTSSRRRRWTTELSMSVPPDQPVPDDTSQVDQSDAVERSLKRLHQDHRTAVVLRYYALLTEQQMAEVLGIPTGTVKSRLSRALSTLSEDPSLEVLRGTR